jgi:small-conductance mechanosensitive channel
VRANGCPAVECAWLLSASLRFAPRAGLRLFAIVPDDFKLSAYLRCCGCSGLLVLPIRKRQNLRRPGLARWEEAFMRVGRRCVGWGVWVMAVLFALFPLFAAAQFPASGEAAQLQPAQIDVADVKLDGRPLFRVRGVTSIPAKKRVKNVAERLRSAAEDTSLSSDSLRAVPGKDGRVEFYLGDRFLFALFDVDAEVESIPLATLADVVQFRVKAAIDAYREERTLRVVLRNIGAAIVQTLLLLAVLFGLRRLFGWLDQLVEVRLSRQIEALEQKSLKLVKARHIGGMLRKGMVALRVGLMALFVYVYLNSVLSLFPLTREIGELLLSLLVDPLITVGHGIVGYLPSLVFLAIVVTITRYALGSVRAFFGAIQRERIRLVNFEPEWALPTYRLVRLGVIAFAVVIAYPYIPGSGSDAFKGVSLFLGVLFSIGSTSVIANVVAGYTMTYRRAFRIGDRVQIGDTVGDVMEIRLLVTRLRSLKNEEIVIPNSVILNNNVVNYTALAGKSGLILHTTVGIGYEVPWRQVEAMLLMAAERTPGLLREPAPFVLQTGLGDFAVNYELNAYCGDASRMARLYSEMHRQIQDVFNEFGVQIMTPSYEADPPQPKLVSKEHWYEAPAVVPTPDVKARVEV